MARKNPIVIKKKPKSASAARRREAIKNLAKASDASVVASQGNQWWKLRTKHGVDALFTEAMTLLKAAEEYFKMVDAHPIEELEEFQLHDKKLKRLKTVRSTIKRHKKPYTLEGFCLFLNVGTTYWSSFKKSQTAQSGDFPKVISLIEAAMRAQKLEGAAAGIFNANIIARDLGLRENVDSTSGGEKLATPLQVNVYNTAPPMAESEQKVEDKETKKKSKS